MDWTEPTEGAITKSFFPIIEDRLKLTLNATPKFAATVTDHGNVKAYSHKYKIIDNPTCLCKKERKS